MSAPSGSPRDIDEYIAAASPGARPILSEIRRIVREVVPGATETISYRMPTFRDRKIFFHFAAFRSHIGIYPPIRGDAGLLQELRPYRGPKDNLKFPLDEPFPFDLVRRVAEALWKEHGR